jgi:hypothetical protein
MVEPVNDVGICPGQPKRAEPWRSGTVGLLIDSGERRAGPTRASRATPRRGAHQPLGQNRGSVIPEACGAATADPRSQVPAEPRLDCWSRGSGGIIHPGGW